MMQGDFWKLVCELEDAGLAHVEQYICEGTPDEQAQNLDGTMVLLHPGLTVEVEDWGTVETIQAGHLTRSGMMAAPACDPRDYITTLGFSWDLHSWQYIFVADSE